MAARRAHNPKVVGSNPTPATKMSFSLAEKLIFIFKLFYFLNLLTTLLTMTTKIGPSSQAY